MVAERGLEVGEAAADRTLDTIDQGRELVRRAARGRDLRFQHLDARGALLQLGHELGDLIGKRDRLREPLLLGANRGELGLERGNVELALGHLRGDLVADLIDQRRQHLLAEHVRLELVDQRRLDLVPALIDGDRADRAAPITVTRAPVGDDALASAAMRAHALRGDRAAARAAVSDAAECVLRRASLTHGERRLALREACLHGHPRRLVDDSPLGDLGGDDVLRIGFDVRDAAGLAHLLDAAVHVHAAIPRVEEDRADRTGGPRTAAATTCSGRAHAIVVQAVSDRLDPVPREELVEDAAHDLGFLFVHDSDRVLATGAIGLALQRVTEAAPAGDATVTDSRAQRFARARADRLELHLMAGALDEGRRLIDRVCEQHLLAGRVVVELAAAIPHEVADHERHLDRVAAEARLIAAHDHVAAPGLGDQRLETGARVEVVARATVIDVVAAFLAREAKARDQLAAPVRLHVEAELLLAFVVLRSSAVGPDHHRFIPPARYINSPSDEHHLHRVRFPQPNRR